jgi:nitroimidazol reductase NimA-like FMN-containing flavoprotein (pyridoxamine 5'-phosphate oxidase superfamily)
LLRSRARWRDPQGEHHDTEALPRIAFRTADGALIGHSAEGMKLKMLRKGAQVCIEIDHVDDVANWRSVIGWGWFKELDGDEAERALDLLMACFVALAPSETSVPRELFSPTTHACHRGTVIFRL